MNSLSTESKAIKKFGCIALPLFGTLFAIGVWRQKPVPIFLFGFLSCLGIGFILIPGVLKPVYRVWLKAAHFIGRVITTLMLVIAYYGIVTPTALIKKIFGASPLPLTPDPSVTTYWREREEPAQPKGRFIKRY